MTDLREKSQSKSDGLAQMAFGPTSNYAWAGVFENTAFRSHVPELPMGRYLNPKRRLIPDFILADNLGTFTEPFTEKRFHPAGELVVKNLRGEREGSEYGWKMEPFLSHLFPSDSASQHFRKLFKQKHGKLAELFWPSIRGSDMLKDAFLPFHRKMAEKFYEQYRLTYNESTNAFKIGDADISKELREKLDEIDCPYETGQEILLELFRNRGKLVHQTTIEVIMWGLSNFFPNSDQVRNLNRVVSEISTVLRSHNADYYIAREDDGFSLQDNEDEGAIQPHFARLTGSDALGCFMDSHYDNIGHALRTAGNVKLFEDDIPFDEDNSLNMDSVISEYFAQESSKLATKGGRDMDIAYVQPQDNLDPDFIKSCWNSCRKFDHGYEESEIEIDGVERKIYRGTNYEVVEYPLNEAFKIPFKQYRGWKLTTAYTYDNTPILIFQSGIFSAGVNGFNPYKEDSLELTHQEFTIDVSTVPQYFDRSDTRHDTVSVADRLLWLPMKSMSKREMDLVISLPFSWPYDTFRYGRYKMDLIPSMEFFIHEPSLIERTTRAIKHLSLRVGLFDLNESVAGKGEKVISPDLWEYVNQEKWRSYLIYTLFASAHLSPIVFAANLIPNSKLDALPDQLKEKLAFHGIDFTFSFGQLWPAIGEMTPAQIEIFLDAIPDQETYLKNYYQDRDDPTHQGLYFIVTALKKAGVKINGEPIPELNGNTLLQALYIFRHPEDKQLELFGKLNEFSMFIDELSESVNDQTIYTRPHSSQYTNILRMQRFQRELSKFRYVPQVERLIFIIEYLLRNEFKDMGLGETGI